MKYRPPSAFKVLWHAKAVVFLPTTAKLLKENGNLFLFLSNKMRDGFSCGHPFTLWQIIVGLVKEKTQHPQSLLQRNELFPLKFSPMPAASPSFLCLGA